jgi:hypothetical protein
MTCFKDEAHVLMQFYIRLFAQNPSECLLATICTVVGSNTIFLANIEMGCGQVSLSKLYGKRKLHHLGLVPLSLIFTASIVSIVVEGQLQGSWLTNIFRLQAEYRNKNLIFSGAKIFYVYCYAYTIFL